MLTRTFSAVSSPMRPCRGVALALALLGAPVTFAPAYAGDIEITSKVMLIPTEERGFGIADEMDVTLPSIDDPEVAADLIRTAHKVCPYSNATRGNIDVDFTVNGTPLEG